MPFWNRESSAPPVITTQTALYTTRTTLYNWERVSPTFPRITDSFSPLSYQLRKRFSLSSRSASIATKTRTEFRPRLSSARDLARLSTSPSIWRPRTLSAASSASIRASDSPSVARPGSSVYRSTLKTGRSPRSPDCASPELFFYFL